MSKVAKYLNEHILGEVVVDPAVLAEFSTDASVLTMTPEMVVYPRTTNDIRKVARFAWQLAEKGHVMPLTARGGGSDDTGAAIGKGAIIALMAHLNKIFEYEGKQKLVRLQPGVNAGALNAALALQGTTIPVLPSDASNTTIGGAIAYDAANAESYQYGSMANWVDQLEVVLANGDVLQTERLNKRGLNKKKGLQGLEGDIYRKLDGLIEDNKELIQEKLADPKNRAGYARIAEVKGKDGSFNLTPLIIGSQGTLGIVSEMILKTEYTSDQQAIAVLSFADSNAARDAVDMLAKLQPSYLEYFDGAYFAEALKQGKHYAFYDAASANMTIATVLVVGLGDFSKRKRARGLKKAARIARELGADFVFAEGDDISELAAVRSVTSFTMRPSVAEGSAPPLFDGVYVPFERFEDFSAAVAKLASKHGVTLPLYVRPLDGIVSTRPVLHLKKVSEKQKLFKLLDEYAALVASHNGYLISASGEGRFKSHVVDKYLDDDVKALFAAIKEIFDPYGILNPGVKQPTDIKQIASHLRSTYDTAAFADFAPHNS